VLKGNLFYILFSDSVNSSINVSSKERMIVNNELIRMGTETRISSVDGCVRLLHVFS
jgi:hypothetical protein